MTAKHPNPPLKGLSVSTLLVIAAVLTAAGMASTLIAPPGQDFSTMGNAQLTAAVILELASWAALPVFTWVLVLVLRRGVNPWRVTGTLLGLAILSEPFYDQVNQGKWFALEAQSPVWGFLLAMLLWAILRSTRNSSRMARAVIVGTVFLATIIWAILMNVGTRFGFLSLGVLILVFFLVFATLWTNENAAMLTAGGLGAMMLLMPGLGVVLLHYRKPLDDASWALPKQIWLWAYPVALGITALVSP
ncbi:hypothetical protein NQ015_03185 [Corynebacterium sp. 153RC1]|uniref:hypothetical protein n=1 Tax=unclassified Corynebacterium TaxID=2624378 RepID=UPI00211BBE94|nr:MULTISPECIES: hypothetical protein [unclassified Corynebacterium]MCQ9370100.1 hypothetical protein [Corynebacterium sp. 35RC1]MCQ9351874.1 hypothetical protein [Corynebacterium sp. 209RC1]MCQ9355031.1 hypothetical protein [Corynebacterium sp. 1222RC1]MCQ9356156.1 hypothetical protein [Corynebacterium sp. 122RC1]MCQ9359551.1 hypothetical protein [Corynebacterium sp. 142RC1]